MPTKYFSQHRLFLILSMIILLIAIIYQVSSETPLTLSHLSGHTMGTSYSVKYRHSLEAVPPETLHNQIETLLVAVNHVMSTYDSDSELSRFNRAKTTDWISVTPSLFTVLAAASEVHKKSKGAFDITVGPLVNLWGFGPEIHPRRIPSEAEIMAAREQTGQNKLILHETLPAIRKTHTDIMIDLSGIAKGYAVDQVAELLQSHDIQHYMIEIGGEIRVQGHNAQEAPWHIGIEKPLVETRSLQKILTLENTALATSGDYRNFFEIAGQRYIHTIDPVTGWPLKNQLASVTVMTDSCMYADAWATALQILGLDHGMRVAEQLGLPVLFIINRNGVFEEHMSRDFQPNRIKSFMMIFIASFFIIGVAILAMAIGALTGRPPLGGSCGGLARLGLKCDLGCNSACQKQLTLIQPDNKPHSDRDH